VTAEELQEVLSGKRPVTKRLALVVCEALLAVIKAVKDEGPVRLILCDKCAALASEEIAKHGSFALGYMTKARVAAARIAEVPMP